MAPNRITLLERERRRHGLTATELAQRMGTSPSAVSQVERGRSVPSRGFKRRAASVLGTGIASLFPEFFALVSSDDQGLLLRGRDGNLLVFTTRGNAELARSTFLGGKDGTLRICGPVPLPHLSTLLDLAEDECQAQLCIDATNAGGSS